MENPFADADDARVAALEAQLAERTADLQRVQADFVNYRRRMERERATDRDLAAVRVLEPLLPVLDDIDRAEAHGELDGGFGAVARRLLNELGQLGLQRYGKAGDPFDPQVHHALVRLPARDVEQPVCLDVVAPGYTYRGHTVRVAHVAVATPTGA